MSDIGCGSGHSLCWCGEKGAAELWGIDLSEKQIENARKYLAENGYHPKLYNSPMEKDCGLPKAYFDMAYSIYAVGWTTDLTAAFRKGAYLSLTKALKKSERCFTYLISMSAFSNYHNEGSQKK